MEAFYRFVRRLVDGFGGAGLDYAFTGALAVSFYGAPRTTTDVDVVVAVSGLDVKGRVASALRRAGLDVDDRKLDSALISDYRIASFSDKASPYTVDVIFLDGELKKRAGTIDGMSTFFQPPEDLILAKLRMVKATVPRERAVKDEEDIKAILTFTKVDLEAVKKQAEKDKTLEILESFGIRGLSMGKTKKRKKQLL
jgi:hypothetical protein